MKTQIHAYVTDEEKDQLNADRKDLSMSNYIRKKLRLPLLTFGAPSGEKNGNWRGGVTAKKAGKRRRS